MPSRLTVVLVSLLLATPAVIFWLWLVILGARVAILCPEGCQCDRAGYFVECDSTSLTAVHLMSLRDIKEFWLLNNNVTLLMRDSFVLLPELEILGFYKWGLRAIELGAFNGLTELKVLSICSDGISEIIPGTFWNLSNLEYIEISYNLLQHLDSNVFSGLVNLKYIYLDGNKLQYLNTDMFLGLPNIEHLFLHNNSLRTVDINILTALPKLSNLYLGSNPLQCDCQLKEVWRWCEGRNIETVYWVYAPECDTPSEVKGMWWGVLERGECLEGNIQYCGDNNTNCSYTNIDGTYKEIETDTDTDRSFSAQYQVEIYAFPFIFGTTSNVILLIIIICNKDMQTVPNMYIINLAISDIIYLTVIFSEACANIISDTWLDGHFMCTFFPFFHRLSVGLSAYSVALLSIQRYRVTVNPLHVHVSSPPTWRVTAVAVCGVWIVAALSAVPSAFSNVMCKVFMYTRYTTYYKRVVIFELLVSCVLPLCVIVFTYITTARHLVQNSRISEGTSSVQLNTRRNTARIVVGLTVVFLISYVPYHVWWTYIIWAEGEDSYYETYTDIIRNSVYKSQFQYMYLISKSFLLLNSCLNPVALFCTSSQFRQHLKRYLTCFCKTNSPPNVLELTSRN